MWTDRRNLIALFLLASTVAAVFPAVGAARTGALRLLVGASCDDVEGWHDYRGERYDCGYWSSWCSYSGISSYAGSDGLTPDQACCACGGGGADNKAAAEAAAVEQQIAQCVDAPGWHDYRGESYGCGYWGRYCDWPSISSYESEDGSLSPDEACCACGGGGADIKVAAEQHHASLEEGAEAAIGTPVVEVDVEVEDEHQPAGATCVDVAGWHDDRGERYGCEYWSSYCGGGASSTYSSWWHFLPYPSDENGLHANEACCACGGGEGSEALLAATAPADESCASREGWHDDRGPEHDCAYWSRHCTPGGTYTNWDASWGCFGDYPGAGGLTPDRACCECGGGAGREDDPASAAIECRLEKLSQEEALAETARSAVSYAAFAGVMAVLG